MEILVAFGLASLLLPVLLSGFLAGTRGRETYEQRIAAVGLLREGEEATRSLREEAWTNIATNGTYYPKIASSKWAWGTAPDGQINGFTRIVVISDFMRNGTVDPSTKKIDITVSWPGLIARSVASTIYLTRWGNTASLLTAGGELMGLGRGDWCAPSQDRIVPFNLDKSGVANAISAIQGRVFAGTGDNAAGPAFDNVTIPNTTYPTLPTPSLAGNFGSQPVKTNGIFGETNYAYIATDTHAKQGIIINITGSTPYSETGTLDIGVSSANGQSIYVANNIAYLSGTNGKLYAFNVATKSGSHNPIANVNLETMANKIVVVGSNIYAAMNATANQLAIIPLTGGGTAFGTPVYVSVAGQNGVDVYVNSGGTRAYLATSYLSSQSNQSNFFIIDTDPTSATYKQTKGSYNAGGMKPKGVTVVPGAIRAILVGTGGTQQYQVIDITDEANPTHCTSNGRSGGLVISSDVNGISSVLEGDGDAYSYIITGDASAELKIIEGGPGGAGGNGGVFESPVFDAGHPVIFNRFSVIDLQPPSITVNYQIAVSPDCTTFNYTGSYDANGGQIPLSLNSGRCFRYKVTFTGGGGATSASTTVSVNYSP